MHIKRMDWIILMFVIAALGTATNVRAIDGGTLRVSVNNGWKAFEVISINDNPSGNYAMPGIFDGIGAQIVGSSLRVQINHEIGGGNGSVSEVNLDHANFKTAIHNMINTGNTGGQTFVTSAQQAYDRWSDDGGATWTNTTNSSNTLFDRFCSGQSYKAHTYGTNRGFVDEIYITGEEFGAVNRDRLFAIDLANRDMFQLSGVSGSAPGGIGGMPFDSWENAALLDTGETNHVALMLSPDGGTQTMQLYIGEKGKDENGNASNSFLARNGLAYGSHYYLNDSLPALGNTSSDGFFDTTIANGLTSSKLEDVDASLADPTKALLGDQNSGLFTFDFNLDFSSGSFNAATSDFGITKLQNDGASGSGSFNNPDNVDWSAATILDGTAYPDGLLFVNEDSGEGEMWMMNPDGSNLVKIGQTTDNTESTGIVDISDLVGFNPGSVLLSNNQGSNSSLSVLINPDATLTCDVDFDGDCDFVDADTLTAAGNLVAGVPVNAGNQTLDLNFDGVIDDGDLTKWRQDAGAALGFSGPVIPGDLLVDGDVDTLDLTGAIGDFNGAGSTGNNWSNGDTDGDGDTDTIDLTTAITNFTGAPAAADKTNGDAFYDPNVPDLIYDPTTGNVWIDTEGQDMISFALQGGPFLTANADFSGLPAGLTDNIATQIGWTSFNIGGGLVGTANLGAILPAGLTAEQFLAAIAGGANYGLSVVTGGGGRFDTVPEPASLALLGLGALALARRRNKSFRTL